MRCVPTARSAVVALLLRAARARRARARCADRSARARRRLRTRGTSDRAGRGSAATRRSRARATGAEPCASCASSCGAASSSASASASRRSRRDTVESSCAIVCDAWSRCRVRVHESHGGRERARRARPPPRDAVRTRSLTCETHARGPSSSEAEPRLRDLRAATRARALLSTAPRRSARSPTPICSNGSRGGATLAIAVIIDRRRRRRSRRATVRARRPLWITWRTAA